MKRKITLLGYEGRAKSNKFDRGGNQLWKKLNPTKDPAFPLDYFHTVQAAQDAGAEKITPRYHRAS